MKKSTISLLFIVLIMSALCIQPVSADKAKINKELQKAIELYNLKRYEESAILLREIILSTEEKVLNQDVYFWLAKVYIGAGDLQKAEINLEHYLANYKKNMFYPEAVYQKGRLLYMQKEYDKSIIQFNEFLTIYPQNPLTANAFYWIGENSYALGHLDDAGKFFEIVINKYPDSYKYEASFYKLRLIKHKRMEKALQKVIRLTQQKYLESIALFQARELTYEKIINQLKNKLGTGEVDKTTVSYTDEMVQKLIRENKSLLQKLEELETKTAQLGTFDSEYEQKLKSREKLLQQKEEALRILEKALQEKEKLIDNL